jgi:Rib/alpha/Esp surface antigen-like repeat protein
MGLGPFTMHVGDKQPSLAATLKPLAATPVGATCVLKLWNEEGGALKVNAACTITSTSDVTQMPVRYDWQTADTNTAGSYRGLFVVTYADGTVQTFPSVGVFYVKIAPVG